MIGFFSDLSIVGRFVCDEVRYLLAAPDSYYAIVAEALKVTSLEYRAHCIDSALTSISYLHQDIWVPLSSPPWMYFIGNCKDNIAALKDDDSVTEPLTVKMKTLALLGFAQMLFLLVSWYWKHLYIYNTD